MSALSRNFEHFLAESTKDLDSKSRIDTLLTLQSILTQKIQNETTKAEYFAREASITDAARDPSDDFDFVDVGEDDFSVFPEISIKGESGPHTHRTRTINTDHPLSSVEQDQLSPDDFVVMLESQGRCQAERDRERDGDGDARDHELLTMAQLIVNRVNPYQASYFREVPSESADVPDHGHGSSVRSIKIYRAHQKTKRTPTV
ncbi:uncharacterized protein I303_102415 [Kwoniella dejecticola CBS 10117]|uniref:Uncharacterized protein n=1 Tax=Kwoniella dejecticola CBS 10117 TaxID=1296121 RepID=A0A1A6A8P1_9TREE|nr:uncharacterized protein I303_02430 [Kwoniella dejecticola CBS 10117]OBR86423.1 hypothetical protein I303_02430 [Kwoniella dejecticola CBS 10117]